MRISIRFFYVLLIAFMLFGCSNQSKTKADLSNPKNTAIDQTMAIEAKKKIASYKETTVVHAVNTSKKLFVAFDIKHRNKLTFKQILEKRKKALKKQFPDKEIEVSTDQKLLMETEKIEKQLKDDKIKSEKALDKKMEALIKLSRKKT